VPTIFNLRTMMVGTSPGALRATRWLCRPYGYALVAWMERSEIQVLFRNPEIIELRDGGPGFRFAPSRLRTAQADC
jgi:hypothetical protein